MIAFLCSILLALQTLVSLDQVLQRFNEQFPITQNSRLYQQAADLDAEAINTGAKPALNLGVQASYQSDVTSIPISIPGMNVPQPPLDRYGVSADISQSIYDGGIRDHQSTAEYLQGRLGQEQTRAKLYGIKENLVDLYFAVLKADVQIQTLKLTIEGLEEKKQELQSAIVAGMALPGSLSSFQAQILRIQQNQDLVLARKNALIRQLNKLSGMSISTADSLAIPTLSNRDGLRPELSLIELQKEVLGEQKALLNAAKLPKVNGFLQLGYARPGLNQLADDFQAYYMVGVKGIWSVDLWKKHQKQAEALEARQSIADRDRQAYLQQQESRIAGLKANLEGFESSLRHDEALISELQQVRLEAESQFQNGVISSSELINHILEVDKARLNQRLNQLEINHLNYQIALVKGVEL